MDNLRAQTKNVQKQILNFKLPLHFAFSWAINITGSTIATAPLVKMAFSVPQPAEYPLAYFSSIIALLLASYVVRRRRTYIDLPELKTGLDGYSQTREICELALRQYPNEPCKTQSDMGEVIIIPPSMLNAVKNLPEFPMNIDYVSSSLEAEPCKTTC